MVSTWSMFIGFNYYRNRKWVIVDLIELSERIFRSPFCFIENMSSFINMGQRASKKEQLTNFPDLK